MSERLRTVAGPGQSRFEIRGSEFIGHVDRVDSVEEAEAFIEAVRTEYDDATHNVPAYRVPAGEASPTRTTEVMLREYHSDDGEPTGSSGKPALNVLQQREVRNAVAVVTRYYGGTNLGVGGLARAYSRAVKDAVDDAGVTEQQPRHCFTVTVDYDDSGTVRGLLESVDCEFEAAYEADVAFEVSVPVGESEALQDRIRSATSGRAAIE
ncbi:MAG: YigZ family protein [Halolamina sp.]|uniref:IMPACT family protein n=1 Tax=Halolamina sp. TaxID=1940283 RepID=UPI002FC2D4A9